MIGDASSFSVLVERRLEALGTNAFAVEQAAGLPQDAIRNIIRSVKKDGPSISRAKEICDAIGLEFYIGPKRELSGFSEPSRHGDLSTPEALRAGYLPIPWLDATARAGSAPFAILQSWLASNGLVPDNLRAVEPRDIHLPFPFEGKPVAVIDTVASQRGTEGLWAYRDGPAVMISRAAFDADVIVLFPGGEDGSIRIVRRTGPGNVSMIGRVVWLGGKTG